MAARARAKGTVARSPTHALAREIVDLPPAPKRSPASSLDGLAPAAMPAHMIQFEWAGGQRRANRVRGRVTLKAVTSCTHPAMPRTPVRLSISGRVQRPISCVTVLDPAQRADLLPLFDCFGPRADSCEER